MILINLKLTFNPSALSQYCAGYLRHRVNILIFFEIESRQMGILNDT